MGLPIDYEVGELLYRGRRSQVYRARRNSDERPVILKLAAGEYPSEKVIARLYREFDIGKNLSGEHIIKYYNVVTAGKGVALVMEDFDAVSLGDVIPAGGFTLNEFLDIAVQLARGLCDIHDKAIIHKDIKPANLVIEAREADTLVKFIDFGLSSRLDRETQGVLYHSELEGTLIYISPEQSGRMNRPLDYRTDFYSLGVTFYELITGRPPFEFEDSLELIHAHLARLPRPPIEIKKNIPPPVSDMILKLLEKNAEDRYQSARGIFEDIKSVRELVRRQNLSVNNAELDTGDFKVGAKDYSGNFILSQKLYGREREQKKLMDEFELVSSGTGRARLVLVSGYSGVGKSSLIQELHKPLVRERGYFVSGKNDQFKRNLPLAGFIQVFQELIRIILTESKTKVGIWKKKLHTALGNNLSVLTEMVPEVEPLVGPQEEPVELGASENQNRFIRVFLIFISIFARKEHPLVIFLDDLQWADRSTLQLIDLLCGDFAPNSLLLIGAYRDNEVDPGHALLDTLASIKKRGTVCEINLSPLEVRHVQELLVNSPGCSPESVYEPAEVVFAKTGGNPFFLSMFLNTIAREGLVFFDFDNKEWVWRLEEIRGLSYTDNVVDLMVFRMEKLSSDSLGVLSCAAFIGNRFELDFLSLVCELSRVETGQALWEALEEGLIQPADDRYKLLEPGDSPKREGTNGAFCFLHDRVQQAAASLTSAEAGRRLHQKIGELYLQYFTGEERREHLFNIVDHLNQGKKARTPETETEQRYLSELNLSAARKAKKSLAYEPALKYLKYGKEALGDNPWENKRALTLEYFLELGEVEYLLAHWDQAALFFIEALEHTRAPAERARIYSYQVVLYLMKNDLQLSLDAGVRGLAELGVTLDPEMGQDETRRELEIFRELMSGLDINSIFDAPEMGDPLKKAAMSLLRECFAPAYFVAPGLMSVIAMKMAAMTVEYGACPDSAPGFIFHAAINLAFDGDYEKANQFGQLAIRLNDERYHTRAYEALIFNMWGGFIAHYTRPIEEVREILLRAYHSGLENGAYQYCGYSAGSYLYMSLWGPVTLEGTLEIVNRISLVLREVDPNMARLFYVTRAAIENLREEVSQPLKLSLEFWPEMEQALQAARTGQDNLIVFYCLLLQTCLANWFMEPERALEFAFEAEEFLEGASALYVLPVFIFHRALACAALYPRASQEEKIQYREIMERCLERLESWAGFSPSTYQHRASLIKAQIARVNSDPLKCMQYFEEAIESAESGGFTQDLALTCELASGFYRELKQERIAFLYLKEAHYAYGRWGARHKLTLMEKQFPDLKRVESSGVSNSSSSSSGVSPSPSIATVQGDVVSGVLGAMDLLAISRASQAIAREINLSRLPGTMLKIMLENAGARRGYVLLEKEGELKIMAACEDGVDSLSFEKQISYSFPDSIVQYVMRTGENVILDNAWREGLFMSDPYVLENSIRSILCMPVRQKDLVVGALYLENNLSSRAFTAERIQVLEILLGQAIISLENARVYENLEELVRERTVELKEAHKQLLESAHRSGMAEVASNILHNVGNVLNSALVPANLIREELVDSRIHSLDKVVGLLQKHKEDLAEFMTQNEKGRKLPNYLEELNNKLRRENLVLLEHVRRLLKNLEHIRDIVVLQQSYAGAGPLKENLSTGELIDDALQMLGNNFESLGIQLERNLKGASEIFSSRHKLLVILVNLIANARDALLAADREDRKLRIQIESLAPGGVRITVADNGVGIVPDVLPLVFRHGFTTKTRGHGFGLHSAANAANELGGRLKVESEGAEQGAVFILELPALAAQSRVGLFPEKKNS